ncbi:redoxin domain-containing protein [Dyadobacter sp. CY356]|nr:redoxin domain-containing protein [Dyadobacter sp. CY356]
MPYFFYFTLFLILLWCWKPASAQTVSSATQIPAVSPGALRIGEKVPQMAFPGALRYSSSSIKLSDFKGKVLILDFWATWCGPCVGMVGRMDSLEKRFSGRVQFLPVSSQTAQEVMLFRQKLTRRTGLRIESPEVVGDSQLKNLFPYSEVPHYIWIDPDGIFRAQTGLGQITEGHLEAFLKNHSAPLAEKKDENLLGYHTSNGSLLDFFGSQNSPLGALEYFHSFFSGRIAGLQSAMSFRTPGPGRKNWRITFTNSVPLGMFKYAYGKGQQFLSAGEIILDVSDPSLLQGPGKEISYQDWQQQHTYCYELVVPPMLVDSAFSVFKKDLSSLFPQYQASVEKRNLPVLALIRTSSENKLPAGSGTFQESYDGFNYQLRHSTMEGFTTSLNGIYMTSSKLPIVNLTGITSAFDMDMEVKFSDLADLNQALSKFDLKIVQKLEVIEVLVIKDRPKFSARLSK